MSISLRNSYTQTIADEFGHDAYVQCMRDMQEETEDAAGIVRHTYEAEFARRRLAMLREVNNDVR